MYITRRQANIIFGCFAGDDMLLTQRDMLFASSPKARYAKKRDMQLLCNCVICNC